MYKRLIGRFLILCGLMAGIAIVSPQPANADACTSACFAAFQTCRQHGALGCDQALTDCLCTCNGTC